MVTLASLVWCTFTLDNLYLATFWAQSPLFSCPYFAVCIFRWSPQKIVEFWASLQRQLLLVFDDDNNLGVDNTAIVAVVGREKQPKTFFFLRMSFCARTWRQINLLIAMMAKTFDENSSHVHALWWVSHSYFCLFTWRLCCVCLIWKMVHWTLRIGPQPAFAFLIGTSRASVHVFTSCSTQKRTKSRSNETVRDIATVIARALHWQVLPLRFQGPPFWTHAQRHRTCPPAVWHAACLVCCCCTCALSC